MTSPSPTGEERTLEQRVAEALRADYDSEHDASHLSWQDFADQARRLITLCRGSIAADLRASARRHRRGNPHDKGGCHEAALREAAEIALRGVS